MGFYGCLAMTLDNFLSRSVEGLLPSTGLNNVWKKGKKILYRKSLLATFYVFAVMGLLHEILSKFPLATHFIVHSNNKIYILTPACTCIVTRTRTE